MTPARLALRNLLLARPRMLAATWAVGVCLCALDLVAGHAQSRRLWLEEQRGFELWFAVVAALVVIAAVIASTISMNAFERQREYATLRALGMRRAQLFALVQAEAFWIVAAGALLGMLLSTLAAPVINYAVAIIADEGMSARSAVLLEHRAARMVGMLAVVILVAELAALKPAISAARADVPTGLAA